MRRFESDLRDVIAEEIFRLVPFARLGIDGDEEDRTVCSGPDTGVSRNRCRAKGTLDA